MLYLSYDKSYYLLQAYVAVNPFNKSSALIGLKTREVCTYGLTNIYHTLPMENIPLYSACTDKLQAAANVRSYTSNDKNHLHEFVISKAFLVAKVKVNINIVVLLYVCTCS